MNVIWREAEVTFLAENAARLFDSEIAAILTRESGRTVTLAAVRRRRQKLGLRKKRGRGVSGLDA